MKKILLATSALLALAGAAHAGSHAELVVANGIIFHGSATCNQTWLDRPGAIAVLHNSSVAVRTESISQKQVTALMARGFHEFDNSVQQLGMDGACAKLDGLIESLSN